MAGGTCAGCGAPEVAGNRFCGTCGRAYDLETCGACGLPVPAGFSFCGACGTRVGTSRPAAAAPPTDERKLATVVFADVVGFTSLAERADPEMIARTVDHAFRRLDAVVADHGGTVDKYLGDGLMAVFGVPTSRDDDAERAVACALEIARTTDGDLAFSVGVNTGEVMVTSVGRDGDVTVIGDVVNVAARLEKVARPGQVVVGPMTAELCGHRVVLERRSPVAVKGRVTPVEVFEAVRLAAGAQPAAAGWPLFGRDAEMAFLCSAWERTVRNRRPNVILLTGPAGVGKTRLADELVAKVGCEGRVVRASYPAYGGLGGPKVGAEIAAQLGATGDPEVDRRLKTTVGEMDPHLDSLHDEALFAEQVWAYRQLVEVRASEQPLLVVIDDAHRSSDRLLDLVNEIHSRMTDVPVMTVLVGRPDPPSWLGALPRASSVRLDPVGDDDAAAFARHVAPCLDDAAIAEVVERAAGNPLFVRELAHLAARVAQPEGCEPDTAGHDHRRTTPSAAPSPSGARTLPPTLQAILAARLDALAPGAKLALQHVAVLGGAVTVEQVAALGGGAEEHVPGMLHEGLLRAGGPGGTHLSLADSLLAEVAYDMLPRHVRADRHRTAAEQATSVVERARHLAKAARHDPEDADLRAEAAGAMEQAGRHALAERRVPEAIRLFTTAVDLGAHDPGLVLELAQLRADQQDTDGVVELLHLLPEELQPELRAHAVHVAALATMAVDPRHAVEMLEEAGRLWAAVGRDEKVAWSHANRGLTLLGIGRTDAAGEALLVAAEGFERSGDDHGTSAVYRLLHLIRPQDERVPLWLGALRDRAERSGDRTTRVFALNGLLWWSFLRTRLGDPSALDVVEAEALALADAARELGQDGEEVQGLALGALAARQAGRFERARAHARRLSSIELAPGSGEAVLGRTAAWVVALCEDPSLPPPGGFVGKDPLTSASIVLLVEGLVLAGRADEALSLKSREDQQPHLGPLGEIVGSGAFGWAATWAGEHDTARFHIDVIERLAGPVGWRPGVVLGAALQAELAAAEGDPERGRAVLAAALGDAPVGGLAAAVAARAGARLGDEQAASRLAPLAAELAAPGLLSAQHAGRP